MEQKDDGMKFVFEARAAARAAQLARAAAAEDAADRAAEAAWYWECADRARRHGNAEGIASAERAALGFQLAADRAAARLIDSDRAAEFASRNYRAAIEMAAAASGI
jgi:hypothetical protein